MNDRRPPIRPRVTLLPFDDNQQNWSWFEEAVRDLLRRLPQYRNVVAYGVQGDNQDGIDIRADSDDGHVGVQCKKVTDFGPGDVTRAIEAAKYPADRFVLALSRRATVGARRIIDQNSTWELWDQIRLSDEVRALPLAEAVDYIERHFHRAWVTDFLGRGRPTTFISRATSYEPFQEASRLVHHAWVRVADNGSLLELRTFVDSAERIAVVDGPIGVGKTKLLYDLTAADLGRPVYFLAPGAVVTPEGLHEIAAGPALIIVDNADDADGILLLLSNVLRNPDQKVILTVSPASVATIKQHLFGLGFEPSQLQTVSLKRLGRQATIDLARQALGREDVRTEEAIVLHASDSPLTTILTAKFIRDRETTSAGLESEGHVRDLVRSLYREVSTGEVAPDIPREDVKAVLQLLAAVGPAHIQRDEWLAPAAVFLGWDVDRLLQVLDAIDDARILSRRGSTYSVAPEILRQSIMIEACAARGRRTAFPERVLEHFGPDPKLLHNLAVADLESRASGGPDLFTVSWESIARTIRDSNSLDRARFLRKLDTLGFFKPDEVFELVSYVVDHPATNEDSQPFADVGYVVADHTSVIRAVPNILESVIRGSRDRLPASIELLWRLGKDQKRWSSGESPIQTVAELVKYEVGIGTGIASAVVDVVASMINRGEPDTDSHSLLDMIAPILARDVESALSQGTQLTIRRYVVSVDSVRELRDRAIAVIMAAATAADPRRADKAIAMLTDLFREPMNQGTPPTANTVAAWDRERAMAFDTFDEIIASGTFPIRELRIAHDTPFYALNSPSAFVRQRAAAILDQLGSSIDRDRYRVLIGQFMRADRFVDLQNRGDWQEGSRRSAAFVGTVAAGMLAERPDPEAIVRDVRTRVSAIDDAGHFGSPDLLFTEILHQRPDLGMPLLETILQTGDVALFSWLHPFIRTEFARDLTDGEALARRLIDIGHPDASIAVANGLVYRNEGDERDCAVRERVFRTLLTSASIEVRRAAAHNLLFLKNDCPDRIASLVLAAEIGADTALADRLYMALPSDVAGLEETTIDALTTKLVPVSELDYWPLAFIQHIAATHSALVLGLFGARIFIDSPSEGYKRVPTSDTSFRPVAQALATSPTFEAELLAFIRQRVDIDDQQLYGLAPFLRHIASVLPDLVKGMITEALASTSEAMQRAALSWVRYVPHAVLERDVPYIVAVLERAHAISPKLGKHAEGAITAELVTGAESVGHYEGAPGDMRLQAIATAALAVNGLSIPVRRFFDSLREHGRRSEQQTIEEAEEAFGPQ